jgi:superoxide dismutase, Fe-Mn family
MEKMTLEQVMLKTWNGGKPTGEFNNAAQCVNHQFFWESMAPNAGGQPSGALADAITKDFGSYDAFKDAFKAAGATQFGSGWAWLCVGDGGKLEVVKTPNAENPMCVGKKPILTMDGKLQYYSIQWKITDSHDNKKNFLFPKLLSIDQI